MPKCESTFVLSTGLFRPRMRARVMTRESWDFGFSSIVLSLGMGVSRVY